MQPRKIGSIMLTLALVAGCRTAGPPPPKPIVRLVRPPPCVHAPRPNPGPVLLGIPRCGAGSECPPVTAEQDAAKWAYIDELEGWADRTFARCGPKAAQRRGRAGEGSSGQGDSPAP